MDFHNNQSLSKVFPLSYCELILAGDQELESSQRLPSVDDSRSSPKVPDDLAAVKSQDNVRGLHYASSIVLSDNHNIDFC